MSQEHIHPQLEGINANEHGHVMRYPPMLDCDCSQCVSIWSRDMDVYYYSRMKAMFEANRVNSPARRAVSFSPIRSAPLDPMIKIPAFEDLPPNEIYWSNVAVNVGVIPDSPLSQDNDECLSQTSTEFDSDALTESESEMPMRTPIKKRIRPTMMPKAPRKKTRYSRS